ncbi:MAG: histidine phosphatase family protein [Hydrogenophaga sp.]|uniref:histidine phosphatase family protein n=1 Tax=Hydrogenophaga sp. TaxID=1904254 RepID=UPI0025C46E08|nr:histidine phosphatase family protein [Hydrogenophaga sp.]MBT9551415.1 histidine phosphatase family protein [Hydrogenophaga sp.]
MKLWLLRHARVTLDAGLCYGVSDVPAGAALTQAAAEAAAALLPQGLPVWVSGLGRAQQLAHALGALRPDLRPVITDTRLNEMDFGHWELQRWDAVPRAAFDTWMADFAHHRFGGAESTQQVIDRVADALQGLRESGASEAVWVTHAGVIRAAQFVATQGRGPIADVAQWPREAPEPGGHCCINL